MAFRFLFLLAVISLAGCSSIGAGLEQPTLKVTSVSLGKSSALSQGFNIGLLVTNPNNVDLPVNGMNYTLSLNGQTIVTGAENQIPTLPAYSDTPITINATADIISVARLLKSLSMNSDVLKYELASKMGLSGWRLPIKINQTGEVSLVE